MELSEIISMSRALCEASGLSGREGEGRVSAAAVARELLIPLGAVETSPAGSLICTVNPGGEGAPHLMLEAHLDQIGMVVTSLGDGGFLRVANTGGIDRRLLPAMPLTIHAKSGDYPAVVASTPPHLSGGEEKPQKIEDVVVDTGYSADAAGELFAPGDPITFHAPFTLLQNDLMSGGAMDDRAGCVAVIAAARMIAEERPDCKVTVVLASMEEVGYKGVCTAAYSLMPHQAIAVDVTFGDGFGVPEHRCGKLGGGPMIGIAPGLDNRLVTRLEILAEQKGIPVQFEAMGGSTHTDAEGIFTAGGGIPTGLLSIPLRNMHTCVEVTHSRDILQTAQLMAAYAGALEQL